jgi:hypothetical protein
MVYVELGDYLREVSILEKIKFELFLFRRKGRVISFKDAKK